MSSGFRGGESLGKEVKRVSHKAHREFPEEVIPAKIAEPAEVSKEITLFFITELLCSKGFLNI